MRSATPIAALASVALLSGASTAEARTVIFKDGLGASAQVTWDTSGGTLKYYGTVYDKKGDGHNAKIFRVNGRSAPRLVATATSGGYTNFGSQQKPLTASLPAHFRVCTFEGSDTSLRCTEKFADSQGSDGRAPGAYRKRTCNSGWIRQASTQGWAGEFVTSAWPTAAARRQGRDDKVQGEIWRDLQRCVGFAGNSSYGMNGDQLHMIKLQLDCHAQFGLHKWLGGPTWDLEASTPKMSYSRLVANRCNKHD